MSVVKINAISVPEGMGSELEKRFAMRAKMVETMPGFEGFELLRPVSGESRYFVYTRWADEESFQSWLSSPAFGHGHRSASERAGGPAPHAVAINSELWSYVPAGGSAGAATDRGGVSSGSGAGS